MIQIKNINISFKKNIVLIQNSLFDVFSINSNCLIVKNRKKWGYNNLLYDSMKNLYHISDNIVNKTKFPLVKYEEYEKFEKDKYIYSCYKFIKNKSSWQ